MKYANIIISHICMHEIAYKCLYMHEIVNMEK